MIHFTLLRANKQHMYYVTLQQDDVDALTTNNEAEVQTTNNEAEVQTTNNEEGSNRSVYNPRKYGKLKHLIQRIDKVPYTYIGYCYVMLYLHYYLVLYIECILYTLYSGKYCFLLYGLCFKEMKSQFSQIGLLSNT